MKKILNNGIVRLLAGTLVLFAGICAYLPQSGTVRAFPFLIIAAFVCGVITGEVRTPVLFAFIMSFAMHCVSSQNMTASLVLSAVCALVTFFSVRTVRILSERIKNKKSPSKKDFIKCAALMVSALTVYVIFCGNIFFAMSASVKNNKYIKENYPDIPAQTYTYYDLGENAYKTCFTAEMDGETVGNDREMWVGKKGKRYTDGIRDVIESNMLVTYNNMMSYVLGMGADNFELLKSDIDFDDGEIIDRKAPPMFYAERVDYTVGIYALYMDKEYFESVCKELCETLKKAENFSFGSVTFVGADSKNVLYYCTVKNSDLSQPEISDFDSKASKALGIDSASVLSYWLG